MRVQVEGLHVAIDRSPILHGVDLDAPEGRVTGLIGPNGCGKSTLLRCIYRAQRARSGTVRVGGADVWSLDARAAGRRLAVVTQDHDLDNDYSVTEIVAMGRTPHKGPFDRDTSDDRRIVASALERTSMSWAADRVFAALSGGERQRVLVARAIAQQTPVLVLDEPTNHLDVGAQLELLALVRELGLTTITALHDLDHALAVCDHLALLHDGRVVAAGAPEEVLAPDRIATIFGVRSAIVPHPLTGRPHLVVAPQGGRPSGRSS